MLKTQVTFAIFFGFLAVSLAFKMNTEVKNGIPAGFKADPFLKIGKGLYYIEKNVEVNWFEAYERCHAMNAELVSFETSDEWIILNNYLADNLIEHYYWTSGTDSAEQSNHVWFANGKRIVLDAIWAKGEPNNSGGNEHCDELGFRLTENHRRGLNDKDCSTKRRFICERR